MKNTIINSVSEKLVKRDSEELRKNGEQLKALQKESEWEKRFDSMFDLDGYGDSHIVQEKVKSFIRGVVFQREKEIAEEVEKMKANLDKCLGVFPRDKWTIFNFVILAKIDALNEVLAMLKR